MALKIYVKYFSFRKIFLELLLFLWTIYLFLFLKLGIVSFRHIQLFIILFFIWLIPSVLTQRFQKFEYSKNFWKTISPNLKFYLYFLIVIIVISYSDLLVDLSQKRIIFSFIIYIFWSFALETYLYAKNKPKNSDEINLKFLKATTYPELENLTSNHVNNYISSNRDENVNSNKSGFHSILKNKYLKGLPELFKFIVEHIEVDNYLENDSKIIRSADPYNVRTLDDGRLKFFINLHELNHLRRINEYMILLNGKLKNNGVYIGKFEPIRFRYRRFIKKYPKFLAQIFYFFDFMWKRVSPKLPIIQKFYFAVTKGKDRALSFAEGLGRLYYSGFEVVAVKEIDNFIYFIAIKVKAPSKDKNPSYGPLFKMKRIGKNGKPIYVYKLRTMHPYSEYLQDYIIKNFGYGENGKPANDFRVTNWGKIARKLWLDELPQLINVFKGEMSLVGVRPLSNRFLKEYPEEVKQMRFKYKPGCIPPYVALLKQDVTEYIESEKIYLNEKEKHPYLTDIKFFIRAVYNILTNKIRSA